MKLMRRTMMMATALFLALSVQAQEKTVSVVANSTMNITTGNGTGKLALYISKDWSQPQPAVTRALIICHGKNRDADNYFASGKKAVSTAHAEETTIVVAPQFLESQDVTAHQLPPDTLRWGHEQWEGGADAIGPSPISSFAAFDAILSRLADRKLFPHLQTVVVAGHSGGGQVVQRYAVVGHGEAALTKVGVHVRYIVANPSSYVYFTAERPRPDGSFGPFLGHCSGYNKWKYGIEDPLAYIGSTSFADLESTYVHRDVIYLLGDQDTDPNHPALDKTCMAEAEGSYRFQRGTFYYHYMQQRHPKDLAHRAWVVPGVDHDGNGMFNSPCGLTALFDIGSCKTLLPSSN
jgi:pimeloyl-ACP methyl ester carboxylesterase